MKKMWLIISVIATLAFISFNHDSRGASSFVTFSPPDGANVTRGPNSFLLINVTIDWNALGHTLPVGYDLTRDGAAGFIVNTSIPHPENGHFCPPVSQTPTDTYHHRAEIGPFKYETATFQLNRLQPE